MFDRGSALGGFFALSPPVATTIRTSSVVRDPLTIPNDNPYPVNDPHASLDPSILTPPTCLRPPHPAFSPSDAEGVLWEVFPLYHHKKLRITPRF